MTRIPPQPKIYHIVHVDRLPSILKHNGLLSDAEVSQRNLPGTNIGIREIKERRRTREFKSQPGLCVSDCVPFYFCPRSVMLYIIDRKNHPELDYRGGQERIIHIEADLHDAVAWADKNQKRWGFTLSNAGSFHFEDRSNLDQLDEIHWAPFKRQIGRGRKSRSVSKPSFWWNPGSRGSWWNALAYIRRAPFRKYAACCLAAHTTRGSKS